MDGDAPLVADAQGAEAMPPGEPALHYPPKPPHPLGGPDAAAGDPQRDPAPAQGVAATAEFVALVRVQRFAVANALAKGLDPDHPRFLSRSVILPGPPDIPR